MIQPPFSHNTTGFYSGAEDHYSHQKRRITLTMPGFVLNGFDFWEDDRVAREYAGQYSTHVFTQRTEEIIANHSNNGVSVCNIESPII